jgi:thiosulfate/3-mercaptopyruvate sulfurtransferase
MEALVSTEWLEGELGAGDLKVIDASLFLPGSRRDARGEYEAEHIPGAVFMDLDEIVDPANPAPHMLPPPHGFASRMQSLGLGDGNRFAHHVALLDGGLEKWKSEGRPVESGKPRVRQGHFTASFDAQAVADKEYVSGLVHSDGHEIVDARGAARFAGEAAEPRPGLASGHIPGSKNLPQGTLFNEDNSWKRGEELRAAFEQAGVDLGKPMVATCGSGITACVLLFGAHLIGKDDVKLYDGSWAEWGADPATPKAVRAA